ncbi:hypothetical protein MUB42_03295 [Apilactobacillus kunkeei]|nr:hypothetical protein MUB42_03295 [Apilactobacillus kunkeei]
MQYNKNQFIKSNDKKIMKKVKKQWVVVSIATLSVLGASAYGMNSVSAKAEDNSQQIVQSTNNNQNNSDNNSNISGDQSAQNQSNSNNSQENDGNDQLTNRDGNSSSNTVDNSDNSSQFSQQISQGASDAYSNKGNNSANYSGQAKDYYQAGYAGALSAMNAYNTKTKGQGTGTQDTNYYGNTPNRPGGYTGNTSDGAKGDSGGVNNTTNQDNGSGNNTSYTQNPTDGTPLSYNSPSNPNQGGADDTKSGYASAQKYQDTLLSKLNTANNHSVQFTNGFSIDVPAANDVLITNDRNKYAQKAGLATAFDQGVNYALTQQGYADAEAGKWTGVSGNGTSTSYDFYDNGNTDLHNSQNPYDLAYIGAKDAIRAQYDSSNNYLKNNLPKAITTSQYGSAYVTGFNDVVSNINKGVAYVTNSNQFDAVMTNGQANYSSSGSTPGNITTVKLAADVDFTGAPFSENNNTYTGNSGPFTVDGQFHMLDMHGVSYKITNASQINLQNFQALYGYNYYGPFAPANSSQTLHYKNLNYIGSQLLSATSNDTYFAGNVNVLIPQDTSNPTYYSPFTPSWGINVEGGGNQENLEINNFILEPNSNYFGTVGRSIGATLINANGNVTLGQGSKMTLIPRGQSNGQSVYDGGDWGIYFSGGGQLNVNKDATLNIIPSYSQSGGSNYAGGGIATAGSTTINVNGGAINYIVDGMQPDVYNQVFDFKANTNVNVLNGGLIQIKLTNNPGQAPSYGGIINFASGGSMNVGNRGNLIVTSDNTGQRMIPFFGNLNINNVGASHVVLAKNSNTGSFSNNSISAYTVSVDNKLFYYFNLPSGSTNYTGIDSTGKAVSGTISDPNRLEIGDVPSVSFVGPITKNINSDDTATVTAYAKVSKYDPSNGPIYVGVYTGTDRSIVNQSTKLITNPTTNKSISNGNAPADPNTYSDSKTLPTSYKDGQIVPITFTIPKSLADNSFTGMRLTYGISSVVQTTDGSNYSNTTEGYNKGSNGKVRLDNNGTMQTDQGNVAQTNNGITDGMNDSINGNGNAKAARTFNVQTSADYLSGYDSAVAGYKAFDASNPDADYTKLDSFNTSSNPTAFIKGYQEASYRAGVNDARLRKPYYKYSNPDYNNGVKDYFNSANGAKGYTSFDPTKNLNNDGMPAIGIKIGIADKKGFEAFIADEKSGSSFTIGNLNGSKWQTIKDDSDAVNAYLSAVTGFNNAITMTDSTSANPDVNSNNLENTGFMIGKSLVNGAKSKVLPTTMSPTIPALSAGVQGYYSAQAGFNAVQAAVDSVDGKDVKNIAESSYTDPSQLSGTTQKNPNGTNVDLMVYKQAKFGAYQALLGKSDSGLNQLQLAGYTKAIGPIASANAIRDFQKGLPQAYAQTDTTVRATTYRNAYLNAQSAFTKGQQDGLAAVLGNANVSHTASDSAANQSSEPSSYKLGYQAAVDGYKDGSAGTNPTSTNKDNNQPAVYTSGYQFGMNEGRRTAGANDFVNHLVNTSVQTSDAKYTDGISAATKGYNYAYDLAQVTANPTTDSSDHSYVIGFNAAIRQYAANVQAQKDTQGYIDGAKAFANNQKLNVPANQTTAYQNNYSAGFNAASAGLRTALNNLNSSNKDLGIEDAGNYTADNAGATAIGYYAFNAQNVGAKQAFLVLDAQGKNITSQNNSTVAYGTAVDAYYGSLANIQKTSYKSTNDTTAPLYQALYQFISNRGNSEYKDGYNAYLNGTTQPTNGFGVAGYNDASDGFNQKSAQNGANVNSDGYNAGLTQYKNYQAGVAAANADITAKPDAVKNNKDASDAFDATDQGYSDGLLNPDSQQTTTTLTNKGKIYQLAYNQALPLGQQTANKAYNDIVYGKITQSYVPANKGISTFAYMDSINAIVTGFQDAINSKDTHESALYEKGIQIAQNAYSAAFNTLNNIDSASHVNNDQSLPANTYVANDASNAAIDSYNDVLKGNGQKRQDLENQSFIYDTFYNYMFQQLQMDYQNGEKNFDSQTPYVGNFRLTDSKAFNSGYLNKAYGFKAGITGNTSNDDIAEYASQGYNVSGEAFQAGLTEGKSYADAFKNALNQSAPQSGSDISNAVNDAFTAVNKNGVLSTPDNDKAPLYKKTYYIAAQMAVTANSQGANGFVNGLTRDNAGSVSNFESKSYVNGWDNARSGLLASFKSAGSNIYGNSQSAGYFYGKNIYSGAMSAVQPTNTNSTSYKGYVAAQAALNQAKQDYDQNKKIDINNLTIPTGYDNGQTEAYKAFYQGAYYQYKQESIPDDYSNDLSQNAYKLSRETNQVDIGASDFVNGKAQQSNNPEYVNGYSIAETGYQDGLINGSSQQTQSESGKSKAYTMGYDAGLNKHDSYVKAVNKQDSDGTQTYAGAKQALDDYANASTDDAKNAIADKTLGGSVNAEYANAYNAALRQARMAAQQGASDFSAGQKRAVLPFAAMQDVYNENYNEAQKGFLEGLNNSDAVGSTNAENTGIKASQTYSAGYLKAVSDVEKGSFNPNAHPELVGYADTVQAIKDANNNQVNNQNTSPIYAVVASQQLGLNDAVTQLTQSTANAKELGPNDSVDNNQSMSNDSYKTGFNSVIDGYLDGKSSTVGSNDIYQNSPNKNNPIYQFGYGKGNAIGRKEIAATDFLKGSLAGATDTNYKTGYTDAQNGYSDGISGSNSANISKEYDRGFEVGQQAKNDYQAAESKQSPSASDSNSDTYKGVADAISSVKSNGSTSPISVDSSHNAAYVMAYNKAANDANNASAAGLSDFKNGLVQNLNSQSTVANQAVYNQAYNDATAGYKLGLSGGTTSEPTNANAKAGYDMAKAVQKGYQDAMNDFLSGKSDINANSEPGYKDTMGALVDAQKNIRNVTNTSPLYAVTYSQEVGSNDGISAVKNNPNTSSDTTVPASRQNSVNASAYQSGYKGAVDGYKDGAASTQGASTNKNANQASEGNNAIYQNAYNQGNASGRQQAGANDYTKGTVDQQVEKSDNNYATGVNTAASGFNDGKQAGQTSSSVQPTNTDKPYVTGFNQGVATASGSSAAVQPGNKDDSGLTGDAKNAYYGTKDGYLQGANAGNTITNKPSDNKGADTQSNSYTAAQQDAYNDALAKANLGAQNAFSSSKLADYSNWNPEQQMAYDTGVQNAQNGYNEAKADIHRTQPSNNGVNMVNSFNGAKAGFADGTVGESRDISSQPAEYQSSYKQAKAAAILAAKQGVADFAANSGDVKNGAIDALGNAESHGYQAAFQGYTDQDGYSADSSNTDPSYQSGISMSNDKQNGEMDAVSDPSQGSSYNGGDAAQKAAYAGTIAGYMDGANGTNDNSQPNDKTQAKIYIDSYKFGKGLGKQQSSLGAHSYVKNMQMHPSSALDGKAQQIGYAAAQKGFSDGLNNQNNSNNQAYGIGYDSAKSAQIGLTEAEAGNSNSANSVSDRNAYSDAQTAYNDASTALSSNPDDVSVTQTNKTPAYQYAYNQAKQDLNAQYVAGKQQFLNKYAEGISQADTSSAKSIQGQNAIKQGFNEAIKGFNDGMNGANTPTLSTSSASAGFAEGQQALNAVNEVVGGQSTPDSGNNDASYQKHLLPH